MKKSVMVAVAGVITAVSVVLLQLGSIVWMLAYLTPLLCGLAMIIVTESASAKTAWLIYVAVSLLSLLILSDKESALLYTLFFGYYPMAVTAIEKMKWKWLQILLKLLLFNVGVIAAELLCTFVFGVPFDDFLGVWGKVILLVTANVILFAYDRLLRLLRVIYRKKYKSRIDKYLH